MECMDCCSPQEACDKPLYSIIQQDAMVNAVYLTTAFYEFEHVVYSPVMFSLVFQRHIKRHARPHVARILAVKSVVRHIL